MDFSRYAGQTRPWTASDAALVLEVERQTDEELLRAARKESAQRQAARRPARAAVSKPDSPCAHPRTVDEGYWRICLDCGARWLPEVEPPPEEPTEPDDGDR
jgi:hypothetical protein